MIKGEMRGSVGEAGKRAAGRHDMTGKGIF